MSAALAGVWLSGIERRKAKKPAIPRVVLPFSAGVLLGVALFGLLPELALESGWITSLVLFGSGYGMLVAVDRCIYSVCPNCSHHHQHEDSHVGELYGFAAPLVLAAALHSFLDGWSVALVQSGVPSGPQDATTLGLRFAVPLAVTLHKIPEGIALGGILRSACGSRRRALIGCFAAEGCTLLGGALGLAMTPALGTSWILYPLGLTAGWIFYLGFHAVHEEWKHGGALPAFFPALTGLAGAAVIQRSAEALFR
jgi:zinc transporter ZupT